MTGEPSTDFDFDALDREPDADAPPEQVLRFNRRAALAILLGILTDGATPLMAGRRAFLLAHELKLGTAKSKKELAARFGISQSRLSHDRNSMTATIAALQKAFLRPERP